MLEQQSVVNPSQEGKELTTPQQEIAVPEEAAKPTQAGDKTDPNLLLKSLQEERQRRKQIEEELLAIKSSTPSEENSEAISDEGKLLEKQIHSLKSELSEVKSELNKKDILISHPELKEQWAVFEEFRSLPDNKGMNLRTAAKAFLIENGMLETPRKGLEKPTGGPRVTPASGMTAEDVKTLRETNFRKYQELLMNGQIKIE